MLKILIFLLKINSGRGDMIRTCDPLIPNQMRYQTALRPANHQPLIFYDFIKEIKNILRIVYINNKKNIILYKMTRVLHKYIKTLSIKRHFLNAR